MSVKVKINEQMIRARIQSGTSTAQQWLDVTVAKDTDAYVPFDTGALSHTALSHEAAAVGSGQIIYNVPYAKAQYYGLEHKRKKSHPKATMKWFDASERVNLIRWYKGAKAAFGRGFRKV